MLYGRLAAEGEQSIAYLWLVGRLRVSTHSGWPHCAESQAQVCGDHASKQHTRNQSSRLRFRMDRGPCRSTHDLWIVWLGSIPPTGFTDEGTIRAESGAPLSRLLSFALGAPGRGAEKNSSIAWVDLFFHPAPLETEHFSCSGRANARFAAWTRTRCRMVTLGVSSLGSVHPRSALCATRVLSWRNTQSDLNSTFCHLFRPTKGTSLTSASLLVVSLARESGLSLYKGM